MIIIFKFIIPLLISVFLLYLSEDCRFKKKFRKYNFILIIIAILIPSLIAGIRNIISVGDTKLYGDTIFNFSLNNNWKTYYDYFHNNYFSFESGYLLLSYIISRFTSNYHILFFIISLINNLLIYFGLKKLKPHFNNKIWMGMFVYYLIFFGETLNIVRQSLSLAIIIFGLHYVFEKKLFKYIIVILIAMQFHISALIGFFIYPLYYLYNKVENKKRYVTIISILFLLFVIFYSKIFLLLQNLDILPSKFFSLYYLKERAFSPFAIATKLPIIIILIYYLNLKDNESYNNSYYILLLMIDLIVSQLAGGNEYLYRMALIFSYTKLLIFSINYSSKKLKYVLFAYCFAYFFMEYIYQGALPVSLFI